MTPNPIHPQSISPLERELGFHLQPIFGLEIGIQPLSHVYQVVALRLSSYEMLLKDYGIDGSIKYFHKRYGYDILPGGHETPYKWYPVREWDDPKEFLDSYRAGHKTLYEITMGQIHGVPYPFQTV